MGGVTDDGIAAALDRVGLRLRRVREQRGLTLTDAAARTGISKSTLSRLENGQRKPSLELLLPLAQAYRVPLDDLVGAPEVGDPRIRLKPRRVNGRTVVPLTHPGGVQAWKIVIPATQTTPSPRAHDGFEWLYVLAGRMRLVLGDQDLVLAPGEAAEFDTQVPHWFGSAGDGPAEVLSIFGRPGERMHVRADGAERAEGEERRVTRADAGRVQAVPAAHPARRRPTGAAGATAGGGADPADAGRGAGRLRQDHPPHQLVRRGPGRRRAARRLGLARRGRPRRPTRSGPTC